MELCLSEFREVMGEKGMSRRSTLTLEPIAEASDGHGAASACVASALSEPSAAICVGGQQTVSAPASSPVPAIEEDPKSVAALQEFKQMFPRQWQDYARRYQGKTSARKWVPRQKNRLFCNFYKTEVECDSDSVDVYLPEDYWLKGFVWAMRRGKLDRSWAQWARSSGRLKAIDPLDEMSVLDLARRYYPEAMQYLYQENLTFLSSDLWQAGNIDERFQIWWLVSCNDLPGLADYLKSYPAFKAQRVLSQLCEPAIVAGHIDMLRFLLDQGADPNYEYKAVWSYSLTWTISRYFLLELTVRQGQVEMAALLLARGAAVDKERLGGRVTAAMIAAEQGSVEMMTLLLTHGANLKQVNAPGEGLIDQAASKGHKAVVEQLYLAGAPIDPGSDRLFFNSSALSKAAAGGHWDVVYFLLDHDPDVAKKIEVGRPIESAAGKGKLDVVKRMLSLGADVNVDYSSPLKKAVRHGHIDMARLLIKHGADVNAHRASWDATPLAEAVKAGDEVMVRLLLDSGAKIDSGGEECRNLLCCALREKNFAVAKLLLARGADIEQKILRGHVYEAWSNRVSEKAYTLLQWAVCDGDAEQVRFLLKQGADIEARCDSSGSTPLMLAAEHGQAHLVGLLVRHGAQMNALRADGHTAYSLSKLRCQCEGARRRHWDTKDKLVSVGADLKKACFYIGRSALEVAASRGDLSAVRELLSLSPEVPKPSLWQSRVRRDGALHNAAEKGHIPVVRELVNKAGYDVNGKDRWGRLPLHLAIQSRQVELVHFLLAAGANVNGKDDRGRLPLHLAIQSNQLEMTVALLTAGADMNARDGAGKTAYNYACLLEDKTILRRLLPDPVSSATQSTRCRVM